ncbi:MAG: hypothetical protein ACI88H_002402 [Cocleimonas sp.]|jgi:hypothetical protein
MVVIIISWVFAVWTSYVFLGSLFYKFDKTAAEPAHIFGTIGTWLTDTLGATIGDLFANFGQYLIGAAELFTALVLLLPLILWKYRAKLHFWGALMAVCVMAGAIFFHLFTPLGWNPTWSVANASECHAVFLEATSQCSDTTLAYAALSILILGLIVAFLNRKAH